MGTPDLHALDQALPGHGGLTDRVALVTGSTRGIGAAVATELARRGAVVVVHGRDEAAAAQVTESVRSAGGRAFAVTGDVTDFDQLEAIRQRIEDESGPVDIVVANAGGSLSPPAPLEQIQEDAWRTVVDANLTATFLTLKAFLPGMKQRGRGAIITMASSAGRQAETRVPIPYAVAKAAIVALTRNTALQVGANGVRVNCVAPETILTERLRGWIPAERQAAMAQAHPLGRLGTPQDVADAVAFLASDQAAWITGAVLDVTGGAVLA